MKDNRFTPPPDRVWWRCSLTVAARERLTPKTEVLFVNAQTAYRAWMAARVWFGCETTDLDLAVVEKIGGPEMKGKRARTGQVAGVLSCWPEPFPPRKRRKR